MITSRRHRGRFHDGLCPASDVLKGHKWIGADGRLAVRLGPYVGIELPGRPPIFDIRDHEHDHLSQRRNPIDKADAAISRRHGDIGEAIAIEVASLDVIDRDRRATVEILIRHGRAAVRVAVVQRGQGGVESGFEANEISDAIVIQIFRLREDAISIGVFGLGEKHRDAVEAGRVTRSGSVVRGYGDIHEAVAIEVTDRYRIGRDW